MSINATTRRVFLLLSTTATTVAWGHHSVAPIYRVDETIRVEGIVTQFVFGNPHVRVHFDVTDESGEVTEWTLEGENSQVLRHRGWTGDELRPGDQIVVEGLPSRDGSPRIAWQLVTLTDGTELRGGGGVVTDEIYEEIDQQREAAAAQLRNR